MIAKVILVIIGAIGGAVLGVGIGLLSMLGCAEAFAASMPDDPTAWGAGSMLGLIFVPGGLCIGVAVGGILGFRIAKRLDRR